MTNLRFNHNKQFKIIQIADVQDTQNTSPDTINFLREVMKTEKPDLVIFTGDQLKGYGLSFQGGETQAKILKAITNIVRCVDDYSIPFAVTYGNHDDQANGDKIFQTEIYSKFKNFVRENQYDGVPGGGTFALEIKENQSEKTALNVFVFDSLSYDKVNGGYAAVGTDQLDWFRETSTTIANRNSNRHVPGIVFQHIPLWEMYELLEKSSKNTAGAILGNPEHRDFYILPENLQTPDSFMLENIACPAKNSGEFDVLKEEGNVFAVFCGHDHNNSFVGNYKGIDLGYTQGCGFNVYGPGLDRGVRVFEFSQDNPASYSTRTVTYKSLLGTRLKNPLKNVIYTYAPSSVDEAKPLIKKTAVAIALGAVTAGILFFLRR